MTLLEKDPSEQGLQAVHKQWAIWSIKRLRFLHPELSLVLYGDNWTFTIHVENCADEAFPALEKFFDHSVRPVTCNIKLSQQAQQIGALIDETNNYEAELWLNGEPLPARDFNILLSLAEPNLPDGGIDFDNERNLWVFRSPNPLTEDEKAYVQSAVTKVGIMGSVDNIVIPTVAAKPHVASNLQQGDLRLPISRQFKHTAGALKDLVQQDEDEWRQFLSRRAKQEIVAPDSTTQDFACLYDVEHCGDSRLSELLTIYDRVDIMPEKYGVGWFEKHQIPLTDLQELVRLKRIRIILPYSVANYPSKLLDAVAEVDRTSIVLSRALAAKTIMRGQMKEPILYAPLTSRQRADLLSVMSQTVAEENYRELLKSYGRLFSGQHYMFMMRGALASLGFGVGAYLGDVFLKLGNQDARLELMTCGAGIEWALGLGASYIPRDFGGGYDETWNSQIVASYLGRTKIRRPDPVANRMHTITNELLAVAGVPPLEVAKNFHSLQISRFRNVARKLMMNSLDQSELQSTINEINAEVKAFEHRAKRLARWKLESLLTGTAVAIAENSLGIGAATSIISSWLYETLEHKIPAAVRTELGDAKNMLLALSTGSTLDAVIVSRSRQAISK